MDLEQQLQLFIQLNDAIGSSQLKEALQKLKKTNSSKNELNAFLDFMNNQLDKPLQPIKKVQRLYVDGCFDLMHSGHFNALRQCKQYCETLVCGVVSDDEMLRAKGPGIMNCEERSKLVASCKWVDEVISGVVYTPTNETLDQYECSHVAHGDDIALDENGRDCYYEIRQRDRLLIVKRTEGISTTDIVSKMLKLANTQTSIAPEITPKNNPKLCNTTKRLRQFCNTREPNSQDTIVYVSGAFDIFTPGHCEFLEKAKQLGTYLILGLHDDSLITSYHGPNYPILSLQERLLNTLGTKYVDEVIIGAPWKVTEQMMLLFSIDVVVDSDKQKSYIIPMDEMYEVPRKMDKLKIVNTGSFYSTKMLCDRIVQNREAFEQAQKIKERKLEDYYKNNILTKNTVKEI